MPFTNNALLTFTVLQGGATTAEIEAAVKSVPPPVALLTALGIYVLTDSTAVVVASPRNQVVRTINLRLAYTSFAHYTINTDSNNQTVSVTVTAPGSGYGGQPQLALETPEGDPAPVFFVNMQVDGAVVGQGGAGYTAPTVTMQGPTLEGGTIALAHATMAGGVITGIVIDSAGGPYCSPPVVVIADATGSGAQAMATLNVASVDILSPGIAPGSDGGSPGQAFYFIGLLTNLDPAAQAAILGNLMGAAIRNVTRTPVVASVPVIS